ncbi:hypothetical protein [uncultured Tateyamaria sp.]|uniref:hypothetical protein n=1 Tax=Tateyamaria sp. 1078 TaxID=3417464 RepID=UPI002605F8EB|nr:hypothetical protein [uncultured Tateyamaria sp.]
MDNNQGMISCALGCWLVAALGGFLAAVLLWVLGGWSFMQGVFVGAVVFAVAGLLLNWIICRPLPAAGTATVGGKDAATAKAEEARTAAAARSAEAAAATQAAPVSAPAAPTVSGGVQPSAALAGEADLAARKGEWKYEGDAAKPKAKAAARPKPAAKKKAAPKKKGAAKTDEAAASTPDYDGDGVKEGTGEGTKPAALDGPRGGKADNLKEIKGIGPKLEAMCNDMGFYHFDQIAGWSADEVAWVNANLVGFKGRVTRDDWIAQAKVLAAGGETEFSKRVEDGDVY